MSLPREDWYRLGNAHRVLRVACRESAAATAWRLGLTNLQVVDMEHGRADPTPLLVPLWAVLQDPPVITGYDLAAPDEDRLYPNHGLIVEGSVVSPMKFR